MSKPIIVVGSLNMDLVVQVPRQPTPGETLLGSDVATYPGGKGANQAVAAARAGGQVIMLGCLGSDAFGTQLQATLCSSGVEVSSLHILPGPSGIALITVDAQGQNMIVVSSGANRRFTVDLIPVETLLTAALIVMQLEIPLPTVAAAADLAASAGIPVLLNCAPVQPLPDHLLGQIQYLVANKSEAEALSGCSIQQPQDALLAARNLRQRGISTVVITLGAQGSVWVSADGEGHCLAYAVPVIDTTAAGDGFCGALAVRLAEGAPLPQALRFASAAAALAVTRSGAQPSLAQRSEIEHLLTTGSVLDLPIA